MYVVANKHIYFVFMYCVFNICSGRSNEMLLYWEYCDQDKDENAPAIANKYYKTLRNLEDRKCIGGCSDVNK